mmetsp:Transcript_9216/g.16295  ORF Transcript_9216/g.16295 Transcript_9216/m.16295 type:complete len:103 (+) Transcript_9216:3-311(+)
MMECILPYWSVTEEQKSAKWSEQRQKPIKCQDREGMRKLLQKCYLRGKGSAMKVQVTNFILKTQAFLQNSCAKRLQAKKEQRQQVIKALRQMREEQQQQQGV